MTSNITKNHRVGIFAIFIASALMLGAGRQAGRQAVSISGIDSAFAAASSRSQKLGNSYKSGKPDKYGDHNDGKKSKQMMMENKKLNDHK
jgi:hypothetical protein